jgi:hypothetical protein
MPSLERALEYKNDQICYRFMDDWDVSLDEARLLFEDLKRFLWLNHLNGWQFMFYHPFGILDDMFHMFILFTQEYRKYCDEVYGSYIDHFPNTKDFVEAWQAEVAADPEAVGKRELAVRDRMRQLIVENLGVEVLIRWWVDYPAKYSEEWYLTHYKGRPVKWKADAAVIALAKEYRAAQDEAAKPAKAAKAVRAAKAVVKDRPAPAARRRRTAGRARAAADAAGRSPARRARGTARSSRAR